MAIAVKRCPHCGNTMSEVYSIGIGRPFVDCSNCGKVVIDKDSTEWELKNFFQKIFYLFTSLYTVFIFSFLPMLVIGFLIDDLSDATLLVIYLLSAGCLALFSGRSLIEDIKASDARMKDPSYRQMLQAMGLLKDKR